MHDFSSVYEISTMTSVMCIGAMRVNISFIMCTRVARLHVFVIVIYGCTMHLHLSA